MNEKLSKYETTIPRVIAALGFGAAFGAGVTAVEYLVGVYQVLGFEHLQEYGAAKGMSVFIIALVVWFICLVTFGGPVWWFLHRRGFRHWYVAVVAGAAIPFIVTLASSTGFFTGRRNGRFSYYGSGGQQWLDGALTSFGWKIAVLSAAQYALLGAVVAVSIWFVAYKRIKREPQD